MLITIMILMMITLIRMMMMVTYLLPNRALAGKLYFSRWPNGENNATQPSCSWKLGLGLSLAIFYNIRQYLTILGDTLQYLKITDNIGQNMTIFNNIG